MLQGVSTSVGGLGLACTLALRARLLDLTASPNPNIFSKALGAIANLCVHEEIHVTIRARGSSLETPGPEPQISKRNSGDILAAQRGSTTLFASK